MANGKSEKTENSTPLLKSNLVAEASAASRNVNVEIVFLSGLGQVTVALFRNGVLINLQSVSNDSTVFLADVQSLDVISVNGICTGSADITISVTTRPPTPQHFPTGPIHAGYIVT